MKKRLFGLTLGILFACGTLHSQTSMPVPFGSFEQWTTHPGYSVTVLGLPMNLYSDYSTPNGWDILTYPINETFSFVGNNITVNTSVPLAIVSQETGYVPNGSSAARLQTFMLNNIVTGLAYAVAAPQLDTMLTQMETDLETMELGDKQSLSGSQEMVIFLTELSKAYYSLKFVRETGNEAYYEYNKLLLLNDRRQELRDMAEKLVF